MGKRKCVFNDKFQAKYPMFSRKDDHSAFCSMCEVTISLAKKGKGDLDQHIATEKHSQRIREAASSNNIENFFVPQFSKLDDQISSTEGHFIRSITTSASSLQTAAIIF